MIKSLVASGVMVLVVWCLHPQNNLSTIVAVIAGVIVYGVVLLLLRGFKREEISFFRGLIRRKNYAIRPGGDGANR